MKGKFMSLVLSAAIFATLFGQPVCAQENGEQSAMHPYAVVNELSAEGRSVDPKGAYLGNGTCNITRAGTKSVNISGATTAMQYCDTVRVKLYLERSTSSSSGFSTYKNYSFSANNVYQLVKEVSGITVEKGYYYRVKCVHSVTENGVTETTTSLTSPMSFL